MLIRSWRWWRCIYDSLEWHHNRSWSCRFFYFSDDPGSHVPLTFIFNGFHSSPPIFCNRHHNTGLLFRLFTKTEYTVSGSNAARNILMNHPSSSSPLALTYLSWTKQTAWLIHPSCLYWRIGNTHHAWRTYWLVSDGMLLLFVIEICATVIISCCWTAFDRWFRLSLIFVLSFLSREMASFHNRKLPQPPEGSTFWSLPWFSIVYSSDHRSSFLIALVLPSGH